jgi:Concanavalin A-like lectin/glucanases superfamily
VTGFFVYDAALKSFNWKTQRGNDLVSDARPIPASAWCHVATIYDGVSLETYVNGKRGNTARSTVSQQIEPGRLVIGGAMDSPGVAALSVPFRGFIQAVSFWPTAISTAVLQSSMWSSAATKDCTAYFQFSNGSAPVNAISGMSLALYGDAKIGEQREPLAANAPTPLVLPPAPKKVRRLLGDWGADVADTHDLVRPVSTLVSDEYVSRMVDEYREFFLRDLPQSQQAGLEALFVRNLYRGLALHEESGEQVSRPISLRTVGENLVVFYHSEGGQYELLSSAEFDGPDTKCIAWIAAVVAMVILMILNILGIRASALLLRDALRRWITTYPLRWRELARIFNEGMQASTPIKVIRTLYSAGGLGLALEQALTGMSWWNWAFTIASTVLSIAAIWLSDGWYLAYFVAQLAINIAQLVLLVNERPSGCIA